MSPLAIATWLIAVFYVCAFFALTALAARAAGRSLWLFGNDDALQTLSLWLFRIAFAGMILWPPAGEFLSLPGISTGGSSIALGIAGNVLAAAGCAFALASQIYMGQSWRIGAADGQLGAIVDTGPFALSRNPVFAGQMLLFAGLLLALPGLIQGVLTAIFGIAIVIQVRVEERLLLHTYGEAYRDYASRVRRWL